MRDGWLDTGDLGSVDDDGFVYLAGRAKDVIIRGGHNIDPAIVEEALLAHPAVTDAAAVGCPDAHSGEVPTAYVTVSGHIDGTSLQAWVAERLAERAAVPKSVHVVTALPLTLIGKPDKQALRLDAVRRVALAELGDVPGEVMVDTTEAGRFEVRLHGVPQERQSEMLSRLSVFSFVTVVE